jgi:hypothetical protein
MNEECYDAAEKRFLAIARGHKNRFLGAWARYRAGIACFLRTGSRKKSSEIWKTLKKTPFRVYEKLGLASIELEKNNTMKAVAIFRKIASDKTPVPNLEAIADIVFAQAQQSVRAKPETLEEWKIIDAWSKLALRFGERMPGRESMTPSILWRWILLSLTEYPEYLSRCIRFLRKFYGEGKGTFAEIVTTIDPLMKILRRSAGISNHEFLVSKVMRLLLNYDDNLGNLETLVRFYMNSGHIDMAKKISLHIYRLCEKHDCEIPDFPVTLLACEAWLDNKKEAASLIETLINKSTGWGVVDGKLLLGLKFYKKGMKDDAEKCWQEIISDPVAVSYNRHLTAKGLLGITEPDPMKAGVPNRSDHRLLYCLFVGYRFYADWQNSGNRESRSVAVKLLKKGMKLRQPSYDIYSAGDIFLRKPLIKMGEKLPPAEKPQPLSAEELTWIEKLTMAASASDAEEFHRTTTIRGINTSSAKNL